MLSSWKLRTLTCPQNMRAYPPKKPLGARRRGAERGALQPDRACRPRIRKGRNDGARRPYGAHISRKRARRAEKIAGKRGDCRLREPRHPHLRPRRLPQDLPRHERRREDPHHEKIEDNVTKVAKVFSKSAFCIILFAVFQNTFLRFGFIADASSTKKRLREIPAGGFAVRKVAPQRRSVGVLRQHRRGHFAG